VASGRDLEVQDYWKLVKNSVRQFCKGWSANLNGQMRREKATFLNKLRELDRMADRGGLSNAQWAARYEVEEQLEHTYAMEEVQWQKKRWT
jgi:hypothetical protein